MERLFSQEAVARGGGRFSWRFRESGSSRTSPLTGADPLDSGTLVLRDTMTAARTSTDETDEDSPSPRPDISVFSKMMKELKNSRDTHRHALHAC